MDPIKKGIEWADERISLKDGPLSEYSKQYLEMGIKAALEEDIKSAKNALQSKFLETVNDGALLGMRTLLTSITAYIEKTGAQSLTPQEITTFINEVITQTEKNQNDNT